MTFRLTEEQAAIVAAPLVPLRVSAGAGTGKTTTSSRLPARARSLRSTATGVNIPSCSYPTSMRSRVLYGA